MAYATYVERGCVIHVHTHTRTRTRTHIHIREGLQIFEENGVYRGGDVAMHFLNILHPYGHLPHAQRLQEGVYWQCDLQV